MTSYLHGYLHLLQKAGHHVLFRLPQFDDLGIQPTFDYSVAVKDFTDVDEIYSISITTINDYLSWAWLKAAMQAEAEYVESGESSGTSLLEYHGKHGRYAGLQLKFSAPRVRALCSQEVVMYFSIEELVFGDESGSHS